eukprot:scaffold4844_cov68-Phaeocystis_antarctica.AAC.1
MGLRQHHCVRRHAAAPRLTSVRAVAPAATRECEWHVSCMHVRTHSTVEHARHILCVGECPLFPPTSIAGLHHSAYGAAVHCRLTGIRPLVWGSCLSTGFDACTAS